MVSEGRARSLVRVAPPRSPHPIDRRAEVAATAAAGRLGIGPALITAQDGILVLVHIEGRALSVADLSEARVQSDLAGLMKQCRDELPFLYDGPGVDRTPAAVLGHYRRRLARAGEPWRSKAQSRRGAIDLALAGVEGLPPGFVHGDVHAGNLIDDGKRLWLVDWEHSGFGLPTVDWASACVNGNLTPSAEANACDLWTASGGVRGSADAFAAAKLSAALRDLFWGYAQAASGRMPAGDSYLVINEERVAEAVSSLDIAKIRK